MIYKWKEISKDKCTINSNNNMKGKMDSKVKRKSLINKWEKLMINKDNKI